MRSSDPEILVFIHCSVIELILLTIERELHLEYRCVSADIYWTAAEVGEISIIKKMNSRQITMNTQINEFKIKEKKRNNDKHKQTKT